MRGLPTTVGMIKSAACWVGWAVLMVAAIGTGHSQETMTEYMLTSPMIVDGKSGVVIERTRFRHRLPPGQAAVQIRNCKNVLIKNCAFFGIGAGIQISDSENVGVQNCAFVDLFESGSGGVVPQIGVEVHQTTGVEVEGCLFEFVSSGLHAVSSREVVFKRNMVFNILGPYPRGQAVQFSQVTGGGNLIAENYVLNEAGISAPQDCINLFESSGIPESPIRVENNLLLGDPKNGNQGQSTSGSGIMAGDGGGSFQLIRKNCMNSPGQAGIGVAGGDQIVVVDNLVRGEAVGVSNVGISVWSQYPRKAGKVLISSNTIGWKNKNFRENNFWQGKAKFGPTWEFSEARWVDNQLTWPEEVEVPVQPPAFGWLFTEGIKYSLRLKRPGMTLEHLGDLPSD